jgi:small redox-active disulfide protein 2
LAGSWVKENIFVTYIIRKESLMDIKILGTGCAKCQQTEKLVREVLDETGVAAQVEKVADIKSITKYGVMLTPAVVVDGEVKIVGKIPKKEDIKSWLGK